MIRPAAVASAAQTERLDAMYDARAAWLRLCALGVRPENAPEHGAWVRAWNAWAAGASDAERAAEDEESMQALHEAQQKAGGG